MTWKQSQNLVAGDKVHWKATDTKRKIANVNVVHNGIEVRMFNHEHFFLHNDVIVPVYK